MAGSLKPADRLRRASPGYAEGESHARKPDHAARARKLARLRALEQKVLWLASWVVHNANHLRPSRDGLKVGGHQASCASLVTPMTALYFDVLRPEDRVVGTPMHAGPASATRRL